MKALGTISNSSINIPDLQSGRPMPEIAGKYATAKIFSDDIEEYAVS